MRTKKFDFGPGALESLTLSVWAAPKTEGRRINARLTGFLTVYCGAGWSHSMPVDVRASAWDTEYGLERRMIFETHNGDEESARLLAGFMVDWALEDWLDPCEGVAA